MRGWCMSRARERAANCISNRIVPRMDEGTNRPRWQAETERRPSLIVALIVFALIRIVVFGVGAVSFATAPPEALTRFAGNAPMVAWDGLHYLTILQGGYPEGPPVPWLVAFFPLYPLVARPLAFILGGEAALLLVANVSAIAGLAFVFLWARGRMGARSAFATATLLACYPPAMFLSAAYSEGLLLLCTGAALWLSDQRRAWLAAGVAGVATAVRPTGAALALVVWLLEVRAAARPRPLAQAPRLVALGAVSIVGILAYQSFLIVRYERFDAYFAAQAKWDGSPAVTSPAASAAEAAHSASTVSPLYRRAPAPFNRLFSPGAWNLAFAWGMLAVGLIGLARPGPFPRLVFLLPITIFLLGYLPGMGARATSIARFEVVAAPCLALGAWWLRRAPVVTWALAVGGLILQCFFAFEFARGRWAG